jgi:hypothetical protein
VRAHEGGELGSVHATSALRAAALTCFRDWLASRLRLEHNDIAFAAALPCSSPPGQPANMAPINLFYAIPVMVAWGERYDVIT